AALPSVKAEGITRPRFGYSATTLASTTAAPVPPAIIEQPQSQGVLVGASVIFKVRAEGTPPLVYQWRWNGISLGNETNSFLTLGNVQPWLAGNYSVVVSNAGGSVTSQAAT